MKLFNVPNIITAGNFSCGLIAILLGASGELSSAILFIYLGAFLDFFDGFFARLLNQQGELGKQLDSLADVVSFGVAPGFIAFLFFIDYSKTNSNTILNQWSSSDYQEVSILFILVPILSLFRLAKFNVDTRQSDRFIGLPTPANALLITSIPLCTSIYTLNGDLNHSIAVCLSSKWMYLSIVLFAAVLLVSELPLFALKFKSFKWKTNEFRFLFLISVVIGLILFQLIFIPFIVLLYILLSIIQIFVPNSSKNEI